MFMASYLNGYISKWRYRYIYKWKNCPKLQSEPQAAYTAFISDLKHRFTYTLRTMSYFKNMLQPLDDVIANNFIPAISDGHICSSIERRLISLPPKSGGSGILVPIFVEMLQREFTKSKAFSEPLTRKIVVQDH